MRTKLLLEGIFFGAALAYATVPDHTIIAFVCLAASLGIERLRKSKGE